MPLFLDDALKAFITQNGVYETETSLKGLAMVDADHRRKREMWLEA